MTVTMNEGEVMTVLGPVSSDDLGITLVHEHLFNDIRRLFKPKPDTSEIDLERWQQKLTLENLHVAREAGPIADNYVLDDESVAIEDLIQFGVSGGGTLVELTPIGVGRDPLAMRRVSKAAGVNVVMGTGWYREMYHPDNMSCRTIDDLVTEMEKDITIGVGNTGVRAGVIGEIGVHVDDPSEAAPAAEIKCIRAAARAARSTGVAVSVHMVGGRKARMDVISALLEEGADMSRIVLCHSDLIAHDDQLLLELLEYGVYVEFDLLGRVEAVPIPSRSASVPDAILKLTAEGWTERILLSQDFCMKWHLKRWGGVGRSWILDRFLPYLSSICISEEQVKTIMVENPKRLLTLDRSNTSPS
jgi:phosphotriesterase-related protein